MLIHFFKIFFLCLFLSTSHADDIKSWSHESEASIVKVNGNVSSESYSAKQKTDYRIDANVITAGGRFLQTKATQIETALQWEASLRYEREISEKWGVFLQHGAESDKYAGYTQRDNTDLGGKYNFIKSETMTLLSELGARTSNTKAANADTNERAESARLYFEFGEQLSTSVSFKLWVEYLANLSESDADLINYEPSMSVMMNQIFSIKLAYLVKYHEKVASSVEKKEDSSFTTSLVAKF